jgi:predicted esterase
MNTNRRFTARLVAVVWAVTALTACAGTAAEPTGDFPAVALAETTVTPFTVEDFDAVHRYVDNDRNAAAIFGALRIASPPAGLAPEVAAFPGRWEGYGYGPPIKRDWKYVLAVTDIGVSSGTAYVWAATNLEFPVAVEEVRFRVSGTGAETAIEWEQTIDNGYSVVTVQHATGTEALEGTVSSNGPSGRGGPILLRKDSENHLVHRDYAAFLEDNGIAWRPHDAASLGAFGAGSLVYLPPAYASEPDRSWPLILFLHGSGDRGTDGLVIAQNSPFRFITAGGRPEAIVVAPLLDLDNATFPTDYLDAVLDDALATYRVDPDRVTLTGMSMGGESAYRFARHRPEAFAGVAVLCGFDPAHFPASIGWGYEVAPDPPGRLAGVQVRAIHGRDDTVVPLEAAQATVDELGQAGVDVELEILEHHDHDVWTDAFADPALFDWLLALER